MTTDSKDGPLIPGDIPPEQSLIEYPSDFPIKVMGAGGSTFRTLVVTLVMILVSIAGILLHRQQPLQR